MELIWNIFLLNNRQNIFYISLFSIIYLDYQIYFVLEFISNMQLSI